MKSLILATSCLVMLSFLFSGCSHARYNAARQRENASSFADNFRGGESLHSQAERKVQAYRKPRYLRKGVNNFSDNFWSSPLDTRLSSNPYDYARPREVVVRADPDEFLIQRILDKLPQ